MITIPPLSQQALGPSLDHRFLKEEARRKVEELAGKSWTDYNTHDPGITILELLAYAITDLGLRTKLEIADLIARGEERPFFTAREALPTATYTASDYRCLLIDRPYIRNAFIERTPGSLNGLNDLLLDLEAFAEEGLEEPLDLQEVWLRGIPIDLGANTYELYVVFPYWEDLPELWTGNLNLLEVNISAVQEADDPEKDVFDLFFVEPFFVFGDEDNIVHLEDMGLFIRLPKGIPKLDPDNNELNGFKTAVVDQLNQNITFFQQYQRRVRRRAERLEMAKAFVFEHRNLCEDCQNIDTIRIQQIGLNIQELVLKADADPEEVVARIFFLIDLFIDPQVQAQSFEALLAEGRTAAEIFDGPLLENGFLLKEKLPDLEREDKIYTSDLIRIIMQQPEVVGVKLLTLDQYLDRMKVNSGVVNCLQLRNPRLYKPKFSFHDSEIKVLKRGIPLTTVDRANIESAWLDKKNAFRESLILDSSGDLPIPEGDDQLDIAAFYSIQNEFPQTYGLREGEVVSSASPFRKAQARQLKAFLLFFEQLLTNYCAQLANIQELFSMRSDAERTYFYQPLYEVPAVKDLYLAFLEEQERDIDNDGIPDPITWEEFKQNCNAYVKALDFATEAPATFRGRRNGFIDHLLARFAEEFTDYAAWAFVQQQASVSPDLIFDKLHFLRQFPALSSERALAFNYSATSSDEEENETPDVWDSSNVSGFEKRVAALLGIPDARQRSLTEVFDINNYVKIEGDHFDFWNAPINQVDANPEAFKILLSSRNPHSEDEVRKLADLAQYAKNYKVFQVTETRLDACRYYFNLLEDNTPVAGLLEFPPNRAIPEEAIRQVIHLVQGRRTEGMHLVEHILLRPLKNTNELLNPVVFDGAGTAPFISDVYSFQVSIFLPEWPPRFKDPEFQAVAERTIREELPAHIFPWIYWVQALKDSDPETGFIPLNFIRFEETLQNWLQNFNTENRGPMQDEFIKAYNELISSDDVRQAYSYNTFSLSP